MRAFAIGLVIASLGCSGADGRHSDPNAAPKADAGPLPDPENDNLVPVQRYTQRGGAPGPSFVEILDVEATEQVVYLCTATQGLLVVSRTEPDLPIVGAGVPAQGVGRRCQHVALDGDIAVVTNRGDEYSPTPHVTLFDVSDGWFPAEIGSVASSGESFEGVEVLAPGVYAVGLHGEGVAVLERSGSTLTEIARVTDIHNAWDLELAGSVLYVAEDSGVAVVDVGDPRAPVKLASIALPGTTKHLEHSEGALVAASGASGFHVLDASTPSSPQLLGSVDTPGSVLMTSLVGTALFVADWNDVRVYDIADGRAPELVATETIDVRGFSRVLALDADPEALFVGEWTGLYEYEFFPDRQAPDIRLGAVQLQFPQTAPGEQSAISLIVANEGSLTLDVTDVETTEGFVPLTTTASIAPGENDFIEVRFQPTTPSQTLGKLTLTTNDPDQLEIELGMAGNIPGLAVGAPIPSWSWTNLQDGEPISTAALRGQVILLSYFATF